MTHPFQIEDRERMSFSMDGPNRTITGQNMLVNKILRLAEKWLTPIYGADHVNWHEMCLHAKSVILIKVRDSQQGLSDNDQTEIARLALVEVLQQFEVVA